MIAAGAGAIKRLFIQGQPGDLRPDLSKLGGKARLLVVLHVDRHHDQATRSRDPQYLVQGGGADMTEGKGARADHAGVVAIWHVESRGDIAQKDSLVNALRGSHS